MKAKIFPKSEMDMFESVEILSNMSQYSKKIKEDTRLVKCENSAHFASYKSLNEAL